MADKNEFIKILIMLDDMSKDLRIGRLTNSEKDIFLKLYIETRNNKKKIVDIRMIKFKDFFVGLYRGQQCINH